MEIDRALFKINIAPSEFVNIMKEVQANWKVSFIETGKQDISSYKNKVQVNASPVIA